MSEKFNQLLDIMTKLRSENGCPWDKEQTRASIKHYIIEEAYEVLEAIDSGNPELIKEELGDLLYQVIFHAELASETGEFGMDDILSHSIDKMTRRHPHVFGDETAGDSSDVLKRWEEIKKSEKKERKSVLDGVPKNLPSLLHSYQTQKRAARVGFDWENIKQVIDKLHEEVTEFDEAVASGNIANIEDELGDIMFAAVNISRFYHFDPEMVMKKSTQKFIKRFHLMEAKISETDQGGFDKMTLAEMDELWEEVKRYHED